MMIESSDFIIHFSLLIPRQSDKVFYHIHFINHHIHCFFQFNIIRRSQLRTQEVKFRFGVYLPAKRSSDSKSKESLIIPAPARIAS